MRIRQFASYILSSLLLVGCSDNETEAVDPFDGEQVIHIGGIVTDEMALSVEPLTRAEPVKAETKIWLQGALKRGLDITYADIKNGSHNISNEDVAILKWKGTISPEGRGDYSFDYKNPEKGFAKWYDNGDHYFEGQYVPIELRVSNKTEELPVERKITSDQSSDLDHSYNSETGVESGNIGNYTLLSHYIGMTPNFRKSATVDQILLPFKHRLSRVIAYVLIDPMLETTLAGYELDATQKDDPSSTAIRFDKVQVLTKVVASERAVGTTTTTALTPQWGEGRKIIPHFVEELKKSIDIDENLAATDDDASNYFIVYTRTKDNKKIYPRDKDGLWTTAHNAYRTNPATSGYTRKMYNRVPIYDIIVRPTYTTRSQVMYDEEGYYNSDKTENSSKITALLNEKNSINFELKLKSGLEYFKKFDFDLDANIQTVVYLTVDQAGISYDATETQTWKIEEAYDNYYGVNNDLGHGLSMAGSSWQRAYRNSEYKPGVTDGNNYTQTEEGEGEVGQYVSDGKWIEAFFKACEDGDNHGDYFVLDKNINIPVSSIPENFVFTGHLDGRGFEINITGASTTPHLFAGLNALYTTQQETATNPNAKDSDGNYVVTWEANVHKENNKWVPRAGYRSELLNVTLQGGTFFPSGSTYVKNNTLYPIDDTTSKEKLVSGYIFNCFEGTKPISNVVPIPQY